MKGLARISEGRRHFSNALVKSPHHDEIMEKLAEMRSKTQRVNLVQFHAEHILPLLPDFKYENFRIYVKKLDAMSKAPPGKMFPIAPDGTPIIPSKGAERFMSLIKASDEAAKRGIALAIGIGIETLEGIADGSIPLSAKERSELLFKAMKAQDSRAAAVALLKKDKREEVVFDHMFQSAVYEEEAE